VVLSGAAEAAPFQSKVKSVEFVAIGGAADAAGFQSEVK
jgi:hypothetical protein